MNDPAGTIFQSFNARFSTSEAIGENFVLSPHLDTVVAPNHTAILGPRGSGKTTLLKMLTLPALSRWRGVQRNQIVRDIDFLAIYIPASLTWSSDYRSFSSEKLDSSAERLLSVSLFRHSALISMLETWNDTTSTAISTDSLLSKYHIALSDNNEVSYVRKLAKAWGVELEASTRVGLRSALVARIKLLQRITVETAYKSTSAKELLAKHEFLTSHLFDDACDFADLLEEIYGKRTKLALCFDELEIATQSVAEIIQKAPRSVDQRLIFKYSAAPYIAGSLGAEDPSVPTEKNDYQLVFLSSYSTSQTQEFSQALFNSIANSTGVDASPTDVFGKSLTDDLDDAKYGLSGTRTQKFSNLYAKDMSFRKFATQRNLSINDLSAGTEFRRAADVRKILWPVLIREEFLFTQERPSQGRQRRFRSKNPVSDIYTGAGAIFALCEGNPRWIIGLMEPMIKMYGEGAGASVKRSSQKAAIERMIEAFFALLSTIPSTAENSGLRSLVDLIDRIGWHFRDTILGDEFNPDPVLSFHVDDRVEPSIRELVGRGINIGAFVTRTEPHERAYRVGEISGLRVRLSHIFAPRFRLPLVVGRTINLSTILKGRVEQDRGTLLDLFGEKI